MARCECRRRCLFAKYTKCGCEGTGRMDPLGNVQIINRLPHNERFALNYDDTLRSLSIHVSIPKLQRQDINQNAKQERDGKQAIVVLSNQSANYWPN